MVNGAFDAKLPASLELPTRTPLQVKLIQWVWVLKTMSFRMQLLSSGVKVATLLHQLKLCTCSKDWMSCPHLPTMRLSFQGMHSVHRSCTLPNVHALRLHKLL